MPALEHAPQLTVAAASAAALELYGLQTTATALPSERDQNFKLSLPNGTAYVLKVANLREASPLLDAENSAMQLLARCADAALAAKFPQLVSALSGQGIAQFKYNGASHSVRLITFLAGVPLATVKRQSAELLQELGATAAALDLVLADFKPAAIQRKFVWDLAGAAGIVDEHAGLVRDTALQTLVRQLNANYLEHAQPLLAALPQQAIHGDLNDYNVLAGGGTDIHSRNQSITGIVDFGDMLISQRINELAVAAAYAVLGKADPLAAASHVVRGYHRINPLSESEIAVLFHLINARLCMSTCLAAHQQQLRPQDAYLSISQRAIQSALPQLAGIHPRLAHYILRHACGLEPVPHAVHVVQWLRQNQSSFASVVEPDVRSAHATQFDLSVGSTLLAGDERENAAGPLTERLFAQLRNAGASIGINGYDEARVFYTSAAFAGPAPLSETRTIHMAIDLTLPAGSALYAPLAGVVHGLVDATDRLDYGPVIVLRHMANETTFYTLYGHLSRESLAGLRVGQPVKRGERIGWIGAAPINGDWWPHVHFQIITDMLDIACNFNGSALASQREVWRSISPDPNLILGIPALSATDRSATRTTPALLASRSRHMGSNVSISYRQPLQIVRGWMQHLYDETGRRYLDAYNNVPHVGHCHPRVVRATQAQLAVLNTNTRYLQRQLAEYSEQLTARFPAHLRVCFFTASGSEANELAVRLARAHTRQQHLIVMEAAYHGHTSTLINISPYKHDGPGGSGAPAWVHKTLVPDVYRGRFRAGAANAGSQYAAHVGSIIAQLQKHQHGLCGFISETCPSVAGQIMLPAGYLAEVYRLVRAAGGVCISDEVQTGFGRVGTHFWAFEQHAVEPDMIVLGKPMGNGYPMGAVITTPEIAGSFANGMEYFSTFGGSTAACAAGLATLNVTIDEELQAHALRTGTHLLAALRALQTRHALIGDVRGSGLFIGVELVRDRETLEPASAEAAFISDRMRELGVLLGTDGPHHNVLKIRPPMPFDTTNADQLVDVLERVLSEDFTRQG
jgi:4-aminobutyrate aminotransferase-like enzyme/Ser/Thr protein kinase RdoA (MazF antagonist)